MSIIKYTALAILASLSLRANTQSMRQHTSNTNAWLMYIGDHKFANRWGIHLEAQARLSGGILKWQQYLLRTALNYHIHPQVFISAGYAFVQSYPYGGFPVKSAFPEHRIWEQLQLKNQTGKVELISRLRFEQRFSKLPVNIAPSVYEPGDAVYTHRFRLLHRVSLPFRGKTIRDRSLYLSVYDELFVNAGKNAGTNILDQNRAYIALGYKIPHIGRLEAGYLEQTLIKGDGIRIENNHTLQLGLSSALDFMKKKK